MRAHQLDANGVIVNTIIVNSIDVLPNLVDASIGGQVGDSIIAGALVPAVVQGTAPTMADYTAAIQAMLDAKAKERNYDNILSACTYASSAFDRFKLEGQACVNWRDAVWGKAYGIMAQVQTGMIPLPTIPALLAMMPSMEWPT